MTAHRILIVEDEAIVARDICLQIETLGYESVGIASTGEEAVALAQQLRPGLVLMDIQLGSTMDGITAALLIREQHLVPVVFLTAFAADDVLARAKLAEPYGYILKPFSERELRTVVEMALYKYQADAQVRDLALRNEAILNNIDLGVITVTVQGLVESCNAAAGVIFGYAPQELQGRSVMNLMPEAAGHAHAGYFQDAANPAIDQLLCRPREVVGKRQDGSTFPVRLTVSRISLEGQTTYITICEDLSQHRLNEERIQHLAYFDELTGLPNRRRLLDQLKLAIISSARSCQYGALIFLDLDHFRQINETLGPGYGDELLCEVGRRLLACVREDDTVAHFGGDEFMVMLDELGLNGATAAAHAEGVANKILDALCRPYSLRGRPYSTTASIGIVMVDHNSDDLDELLKMADAAMYQAKDGGRNNVRFFDPVMQAQAVARTAMEKDIELGLIRGEFVLHYQLQVDVQGVPVGAEALVRWLHPLRGLVSPGEFIPLAEETGLILQLGQWVLESACKQLAQWARHSATAHWTMAVNVSSLQFAQADFVTCVALALDRAHANPQLLKIELTESALLGDVQDVIIKMRSIKAQGVSFSLDDFGTGYSSLTYLKRLPVDQLKIDQSFVRDLMTDHDDAVIARAIVALGHNLGMKVIAEGVETTGQRDFLAAIGCDAFQGYLYARPVAATELEKFYKP